MGVAGLSPAVAVEVRQSACHPTLSQLVTELGKGGVKKQRLKPGTCDCAGSRFYFLVPVLIKVGRSSVAAECTWSSRSQTSVVQAAR